MKTPTNFIPIIGPLYADDLHSLIKLKIETNFSILSKITS